MTLTLFNHRADFDEFHAANPEVYAEFVRRARAERDAGAKRISARTIVEDMRRDWKMTIDNNHVPRYARMLAAQEPAFKGLLRFRGRA